MILFLHEITLAAQVGQNAGVDVKFMVASAQHVLTVPQALELAAKARDAAGLGVEFCRLRSLGSPLGPRTVYFDFNEAVQAFNAAPAPDRIGSDRP